MDKVPLYLLAVPFRRNSIKASPPHSLLMSSSEGEKKEDERKQSPLFKSNNKNTLTTKTSSPSSSSSLPAVHPVTFISVVVVTLVVFSVILTHNCAHSGKGTFILSNTRGSIPEIISFRRSLSPNHWKLRYMTPVRWMHIVSLLRLSAEHLYRYKKESIICFEVSDDEKRSGLSNVSCGQ